MANSIVISIIVAIFFGGVCYAVSGQWILGTTIFLCQLLFGIFVLVPMVRRAENKNRLAQEAHGFIRSFIITLSASHSFDDAIEHATDLLSGEERQMFAETSSYSVDERLDYLGRFFPGDIYHVFSSVVHLYEEQGGEILDVAGPLLRESTRQEEERMQHRRNQKRAILEFTTLWMMSGLVMIILRFGMSSFFDLLQGNLAYLAMCATYGVLAMASLFLFVRGITGEKAFVKGEKAHGKMQKEEA